MKHQRRLFWSWIIALGLAALGLLANWYLVFVWAAQPSTENRTPVNPYQQLYDDLLYPSVRITTDEGIGSGVIIYHKDTKDTKEIYILTAGHVVGNEALVSVELFGSTESLPAFVVATDTGKDLALLKIAINPPASPFAKGGLRGIFPAKLASRNYVPYIFTPIWVVGCSLGLSPRPTEGCITAITHHKDTEDTKNSLCSLCLSGESYYWEMNAPIWPGNSGGGVFLKDTHELIGIAVWVKICQGQLASTVGGIVPLQTIYEFLERLAVNGERFAVPTTENQQPNPDNRIPQSMEGGD
jgi:S1-C subfamily serine protease